jgi:exosome complex component RRP4
MEAKKIVVPGEEIADKLGKRVGRGTYFEGESVFASVLGVPWITENEIMVIPLSGVYIPRVGDNVIGVVESTELSGWYIDINSAYNAFLPLSEGVSGFVDTARTDLSRYYDIGDILFLKISRVTKSKTVQASMRCIGARKLYNGAIIKVTPSKVPRIIGKAGSMINLIKNNTRCEINIGQNGIVWIRGENKAKAIEAILTINRESHRIGLTYKIEKMLGGSIDASNTAKQEVDDADGEKGE